MKRLVLVRHAKSIHWGYDDDFNRELTERGVIDAGKVSSQIKTLGILPDGMISSPASRAFSTAVIFAGCLNFPEVNIIRENEMYHGMTTGELLNLIHGLPSKAECVFLFGHNPSFEFYARGLCESFDSDMPTGSAVIIDFKINEWKDIKARTGTLYKQINPKDLPF
jgi:phosphohistidine phosphatase